MDEEKLQEALELYRRGKVSMWKAARLAGISLWEMIDIFAKRKIQINYTNKELEQDLKALKE